MTDNPGDTFEEIAGGCFVIIELIDALIAEASEDEDLSFHYKAREWLDNIANVYSPPGEPNGGHPREACPVINMESWRARNRS